MIINLLNSTNILEKKNIRKQPHSFFFRACLNAGLKPEQTVIRGTISSFLLAPTC